VTTKARSRRRLTLASGLLCTSIAIVAASAPGPAIGAPDGPATGGVRIGVVLPLEGAGALAQQELLGVKIAVDLANADSGIAGAPVTLDVRDLESGQDAPAAMAAFRAEGVSVVVGAYSSDLSIAASEAATAAGLVYWETGAVADRLTGRGLPLVFRVGASGSNLGSGSATFAASQLAPRLGKTADQLRLAIVAADDDYAHSVADAAAATARSAGIKPVADLTYDLVLPDWQGLMGTLAAAHPDIIILASHIPDGIAFRRAMLMAGLRVGALIGSTMAECSPDFAGDLGPDAVGIFASDRPTGGFQPAALDPVARALYERFSSEWVADGGPALSAVAPSGAAWGDPTGSPGGASGAHPEYPISGPVEEGSAAAGPSEEGLSGFAAAWVLVHDALPAAAAAGPLSAASIAAAARSIDLPVGSLVNGAGVRFSSDPETLGQNERAAAVIWQWQAIRSYAFVWPPTYATGAITDVPLPR
jgi:branched-chain amino acid transport system substrate-binding protein